MRLGLSLTLVLLLGEVALAAEVSLENYVGFSSDSLVFAYAERVPVGLRMRWLSTTTNTIERVSSLDTPEQQREAINDLKEDGFPLPGAVAKASPNLSVELRKGLVVVALSGVPAAKPYKPFSDRVSATPDGVSIAAVSPDKKRVAVRVTGKIGSTGPVSPEYRVVTLFE